MAYGRVECSTWMQGYSWDCLEGYCWRTQAGHWPDHNAGIVLSGGAGALGVQLGLPLAEGAEVGEAAALGLGEAADIDFMQSAVGLVWRATVLWMLLLLLLGLASLAG